MSFAEVDPTTAKTALTKTAPDSLTLLVCFDFRNVFENSLGGSLDHPREACHVAAEHDDRLLLVFVSAGLPDPEVFLAAFAALHFHPVRVRANRDRFREVKR